jgi:hypothetical protein
MEKLLTKYLEKSYNQAMRMSTEVRTITPVKYRPTVWNEQVWRGNKQPALDEHNTSGRHFLAQEAGTEVLSK